MRSMAAYYVILAMSAQEQDADRRRTRLPAPRTPRPSLFARVRAVLGGAHPAEHAASAA